MAVQGQYIVMPAPTTYVFNDQQQGDQQHQILHGAVMSGPGDSGLTYNASTSRKRNMESEFLIPSTTNPIMNTQQQQNRLSASAGTSTSGRLILQPNMEIDALIRLHSAKLRSGIAEIQKRHCSQILSIMENEAAKKLNEKETQIESAKRRQTELEVRLRQLTAENQIWFTVAKNSEAVISGLKANLDHVLRQNAEGHVAADAESCCYEGGEDEGRGMRRRMCRVCGENDVSVLVLPCRHLCLCAECEAVTGTCPICDVPKNVGLQVFME